MKSTEKKNPLQSVQGSAKNGPFLLDYIHLWWVSTSLWRDNNAELWHFFDISLSKPWNE